tara:strand:+ start:226 stop:813 length:588 start_codon:yes stop_codon:yes gene_type:complete
MKKCPHGTICIENMTLFFILFFIGIIVYFWYNRTKNTNTKNVQVVEETEYVAMTPNYPYNNAYITPFNKPANVYQDPYVPPLKDNRYIVPINIETNSINTEYRQVGILTPVNSSKTEILPLMGRPRNPSRYKWQYYTISNSYGGPGLKLPLSFKGKSATSEYGVDEVSNGDTMYAEGYNQALKVTVYDNDTIRYL